MSIYNEDNTFWEDNCECNVEDWEDNDIITNKATIKINAIDENRKLGYPEVRGSSPKQVAFATKIRLDTINRFLQVANPETLVNYIKKNSIEQPILKIDKTNVVDLMINNYVTMYSDAKDIFDINEKSKGAYRSVLYATKILLQCKKL